jgi:hypothetical protein
MTSFGKAKSDKEGYMGDKLKKGDIAVGNGAANSSNRYPPQSQSNSSGGLVIPYGSQVGVYPDHSSSYNGTVKDYGAFDIDNPQYGKGDWIDRWNPNANNKNGSDDGWISLEVKDCGKCPTGFSG